MEGTVPLHKPTEVSMAQLDTYLTRVLSEDCKVLKGDYVEFWCGNMKLTPKLVKALEILDNECRRGSGGSWSVSRYGKTYIAEPDGPFDSVVYHEKKGKWIGSMD
jgi:hypothetical protein